VLDREFPQTSDQPAWRLYRVIPAAEQGDAAKSKPDTKAGHVVPHQLRLTSDRQKIRELSRVFTQQSK
jgi:hypothetical protein